MKPLISVVIPVYNVQDYLEECINSVINQTYKYLEIILINDGSTDNCLHICHEYESKDNRIIVIDKKNGGLSDARNRGIDIAKGEYICFLDSDDYACLSMYENLLNIATSKDVDIVCCGYTKEENKLGDCFSNQKFEIFEDKSKVYSEMAMCKKIESHACTKLYKRTLFDGIRYPFGKTYEDIYVTYKLFEKSKKIAYTPYKYIYYRENPNSITNQKYKETDMSLIQGSYEFYKFLNIYYPKIAKIQRHSITRHAISLVRKMFVSSCVVEKNLNILIGLIREDILSYLKSQYKLSNKLFGLVLVVNYHIVLYFYRKR